MNCRYCGSVYASEDRTCGGCGAPKGMLARTLLDAPATPEHWSNSLWKTALRVFAVTAGIVLLTIALDLFGAGEPMMILAFFWAVPVVPCLLGYAAWRESEGSWGRFLPRLVIALFLTAAIGLTMLFTIGMIVIGQEEAAMSIPPAINAPLDQETIRK